MSHATQDQDRTRWGRLRGGSRIPAMTIATPVGLVLAAVVGVIAAVMGDAPTPPVVVGIGFTVVTLPALVALAWVFLVDRSTLRGALDRPEESVEGAWYNRAAQGAFSDILLIVGLGTAFLAITGIRIDVLIALIGVLLVAMGSFGIRYLIAQRRG
ncbi:hypothetical protein SAMN05216488_2440 [Microbacterium sp. LKL04]|uniref:Uncharacterized protein n=1 Tax=Microbacterium oleivorans TaxID=273677 RepID=A0A4R5YLC6_9MICO|nr:hypothetical protein [Microbacterium]TDL45839.1 hypothetical protein E2R54_05195 [Microbacterium oleivorans]SCY58905.1 hypothetical protein SAMN05216488_2440 [Microbacterium sp. LKL04]